MKNFNEIDANRIATPKQIWAVANRFATMTSSDKSERYGLVKVFNAILNAEHGASAKLTHADIQKFFECEIVPKNILSKIKSKKVSKKPVARKSKKVSKKPEPEIVDFMARTAKPVEPVARVQENSNVKKINSRIDSLESKIENIESGLAQILNHLAK